MSEALVRALARYPIDVKTIELEIYSEGWNPNFRNSSGLTPLKAAVMNAPVEEISFLLQKGAVVDAETAAFARGKYPHKPEILALLEAHLDAGDKPRPRWNP